MKFSDLLTLVPFILIGVGCAADYSGGVPSGLNSNHHTITESYSYEYTNCRKLDFETGQCLDVACTTGKQVFNSKQALCDGLRNNHLNGGHMWEWESCMMDARVKHYNKECAGSFSEIGYVWNAGIAGTTGKRCTVNKEDEQIFESKSELCNWIRAWPGCDEEVRKDVFIKDAQCEGSFN